MAMSASKKSPHPEGIAEKLARLERWLVRHRRRYQKALRPPATKEQLDQAQATLGLTLPTELRALLTWHDGQDGAFVGCFVERWKLLPLQTILDSKKELDETGKTNQVQGWQAAWVPFLGDDEGNYVIVDTAKSPSPVREVWEDRDTHPVVAASLGEWIADFVTAVERGEYTEDPERGEFLRR
jgi:cell wall assembly regulator SMI1